MQFGEIYYGKQGSSYIIKFVGDIRYTLSCSLDNFLDRLFQQNDFSQITIDLTETTNIDSTNLGLLAKIANFMRTRFKRKPLLISTNDNVNRVLDSMGFDDVFERCGDCEHCLESVARQLEDCQASKGQMARIMLDAHTVLCNISEHNRKEFQGVVGALRSRLASSG
ncbi:MAG: STAS domain-containing protein [Candidatus Competibacteraceae bacterium]|nr:STAS domain-containing protein [Candidatus Competibacteraceae bacterium]MCB1807417.1 STAS domain-containing protein [Candidatus Competibacteraceae bacterium]MCB1814330.1 STAS domain-containing protein [Candidatus Competibacteraceae bacterium]